jgi:hyperosmotically inducible periplasmic protein
MKSATGLALAAVCVAGLSVSACNRGSQETLAYNDAARPDVPMMQKDPSMSEGKSAKIEEAVDDSAITLKVKSALAAERDVKSSAISVATADGKVTLSGNLSEPAQIDRAVQAAAKVDGVKEVQNELGVK